MKPLFFINMHQKFLSSNDDQDCVRKSLLGEEVSSPHNLNIAQSNIAENPNFSAGGLMHGSTSFFNLQKAKENLFHCEKRQATAQDKNTETQKEAYIKTILEDNVHNHSSNIYINNNIIIENYEAQMNEPVKNETNTCFLFLSESQSGNKIVFRFYDEYLKEYPHIFIYSFNRSDFPERIEVPFLNVSKKTVIYYDIYDISLGEKYFTGKFILLPLHYKGNLDIGFICMSSKGLIPDYKNNVFRDAKYSNVISNYEKLHFDVLYHCGNLTAVSNLYEIYSKNSNILEIFSLFRSEIIRYYENETIGKALRICWNFNMLNELDVPNNCNYTNKNLVNEFVYYMKIIYERYLIFPYKNFDSFQNFNSVIHLGNRNVISLDCQHSMYYEQKYYGRNIYEFLKKKLSENTENIILVSRPLTYMHKNDPESEQFLHFLFDFLRRNSGNKVYIISFHKNGKSFVQTHLFQDMQISENVCSGFNNIDISENKFRLGMSIYLGEKINKVKKIMRINKKKLIKTDNFKYTGINRNITLVINNFILNTIT
jgi:hypothetical protein